MIDKPAIIITSLGRTGTKFFSDLFRGVIPNITSLHEPDVFHFGKGYGLSQILSQLRRSKIKNLVFRKALGRWSLIRLSDARLRGEIGFDEAVQHVLNQRTEFVHAQEGPIYVESNAGYYGLMDVLGEVYEHHRVAYIVRDARTWIRSKMNWGEMYGKGRIRKTFAHTWPTALEFENDPYRPKWKKMSKFERLCWAWDKLNRFAMEGIRGNPNARLFHFEDIFESTDRCDHLTELVEFVTMIPDVPSVAVGSLNRWLDRRVHQSEGMFPDWKHWSAEQQEQFRAICGSLMAQLGYEP